MQTPSKFLEIDGAMGEGGGQVLRSALSLSVATGRPIQIRGIRAGRAKPGLMRQHLTCVRAAAEICKARTSDVEIGSQTLHFQPGTVAAGSYEFSVGSAGSCLLVLQTVLPPLLLADGPSTLVLEGGTNNPAAPPWELLERSWLPCLRRMGVTVEARLERRGFMPAGGGRVIVEFAPGPAIRFEQMERGDPHQAFAEGLFANLPVDIVHRELALVGERLGLPEDARKIRQVEADGPGNAVLMTYENEGLTEVIASFGMRGMAAEKVAEALARDADVYWTSGAAVGKHLADQLLIPMVLLAGGRFSTLKPSRHTLTNADVIRLFLGDAVKIIKRAENPKLHEIIVSPTIKSGTPAIKSGEV